MSWKIEENREKKGKLNKQDRKQYKNEGMGERNGVEKKKRKFKA